MESLFVLRRWHAEPLHRPWHLVQYVLVQKQSATDAVRKICTAKVLNHLDAVFQRELTADQRLQVVWPSSVGLVVDRLPGTARRRSGEPIVRDTLFISRSGWLVHVLDNNDDDDLRIRDVPLAVWPQQTPVIQFHDLSELQINHTGRVVEAIYAMLHSMVHSDSPGCSPAELGLGPSGQNHRLWLLHDPIRIEDARFDSKLAGAITFPTVPNLILAIVLHAPSDGEDGLWLLAVSDGSEMAKGNAQLMLRSAAPSALMNQVRWHLHRRGIVLRSW